MRLNLTLIIQILNVCIVVSIVRRIFIKPLLSMLNSKEKQRAMMRERIVDSESDVTAVKASIDSEMKQFRRSGRKFMWENTQSLEISNKYISEKQVSLTRADKSDMSDGVKKVCGFDVEKFVEKILDGFV